MLEQIENADRLGYDVYAVIEHFFFPKFSISASPMSLFAAAARRTKQIRFRTMLHALPYWNPPVLASAIAVMDILTEGRYEFGVGRGHGWLPEKAGVPLDEHSRPRYEEAVDLLFEALSNERFSHDGTYFSVADSHVVPFPERDFRVTLGDLRPHVRARSRERVERRRPLLPYVALEKQLDLYRAKCAEHGTTPDIVWIHACHVDEDRDTALREARDWTVGFIKGNCSPLIEYEKPSTEGLLKADYGFYTAGIMEQLNDIYEQLIEEDYIWVGTPDDIVERIEQTLEICPGSARSGSR